MAPPVKPRDENYIKERIEITETGCWEWQRSVTWDGYGQVTGMGESRAHRLSWRIFKGDIPFGDVVCHKCDNRLCVNPDHLFIGSHADNRQDTISKGRIDPQLASEHANSFHATPVDVAKAIIKFVITNNGRRIEAAQLYNVSRATVDNIVNKHLCASLGDNR